MQYFKSRKIWQEIGEIVQKEREIMPEILAEMLPFIEQLVVKVLAVGDEQENERERVVLEFIEKARVEKKNFGWFKLVPYHFLQKEKEENEIAKQSFDSKERNSLRKDSTFQKVHVHTCSPHQPCFFSHKFDFIGIR